MPLNLVPDGPDKIVRLSHTDSPPRLAACLPLRVAVDFYSKRPLPPLPCRLQECSAGNEKKGLDPRIILALEMPLMLG